jgi:D-glycero-alpha-D-manno-heptose-7-phosphate kinase
MISSKTYNAEPKSLEAIAEDLFNLENKELNWAIGRQDQYAIVYGGFNCFECSDDYAKPLDIEIQRETLEAFRNNLLLLHTGVSRNAQSAVEQVYQNYQTEDGRRALERLANCGYRFIRSLSEKDFMSCAAIMEENWEAQKLLASASTNSHLDSMYSHAKQHGAYGGKICGAGGGGAFIFYCENPQRLKQTMKKEFVDCFEIDFEFEYQDIKKLNAL